MKYSEVSEKYKEWANILKVISHPVKLFIIDYISTGAKNVSEIGKQINLDLSTISRHLTALKNAGIIKDEKKGNQVFYSLRIPCILNFLKCAQEVIKEDIEKRRKIFS